MTAPAAAEPYPHATTEQVDGRWHLTIARGPGDAQTSPLPPRWPESLAQALAAAVTRRLRTPTP